MPGRIGVLVGALVAFSALLAACSASSATAIAHLPGFDMTVPASWQVVSLSDPFGTKYLSNVALQNPCAVSSNGADCEFRPLVRSLGADQIVLVLSVPQGGAPPPRFSSLPGSRFTVDRHAGVWQVPPNEECPGTHKVATNMQADIELGTWQWLSIGACMGRNTALLSGDLTRAVKSIHFNGGPLLGQPGPNSFESSVAEP